MHFLLGRYNEREIAASKGKTPPPIEMEDQYSDMSKLGKHPWDDDPKTSKVKTQEELEAERAALPEMVRVALKKIDIEEAKRVKSKEPKPFQKRTIISPKTIELSKAISDSSIPKIKNKLKPISKLVDIVPDKTTSTPSKTLQEESERLKYRKVGIPEELKELLRKKQQP